MVPVLGLGTAQGGAGSATSDTFSKQASFRLGNMSAIREQRAPVDQIGAAPSYALRPIRARETHVAALLEMTGSARP